MVGNFSDDLDESLDTSEHALRFKWSAVNAGYVQDDFINYFVTDRNRGPSYNIIHFLRIASVRLAIQTFIEQFPNEKVQVVNLGCGFDTIALWILQQYKHVTCFDIDLPNLLQRKAQMMRNAEEIMNLFLGYNDIEEEYIVTENYKMVPIDLNNIEELETLPNKYGLQIELVL
uniref:[phosphatase 2A protein]-leucine-carboxy methyltransferase n=1 Tax=Babesia bovis TaxID=5865 RepID=A7AMU6_BABBO|eukprot:XP_001611448.1 hypothetical protein [Babesia bovis T2Bo]